MITTQSTGPPAITGWIPTPLFQMSVDQYETLVSSGAFTKRDRFHLINGYLVTKLSKKPPHMLASYKTRVALERLFTGLAFHVRVEAPVRIPPGSEPEPDVSVARGGAADYAGRHPDPADVALVVEITDSSVGDDRKMGFVYAPAGIPVYWIVNLVDRQVEVYAGPGVGGYAPPTIQGPGSLVPVVVDGQIIGQIAVDDLLP